MGRPKGYRVDEVVARALVAFWKEGFEGTSLKELEQATGLNKFSLYDAFGSKRGLYLACLKLYVSRDLGPFFAAFEPGGDDSFEAFLAGMVDRLAAVGPLGCVLLSGGLEFRGEDEEINALVAETYGGLTNKLEHHWGERARAEAFTTFVRGLMASARLGLSRPDLEAAVQGASALWKQR